MIYEICRGMAAYTNQVRWYIYQIKRRGKCALPKQPASAVAQLTFHAWRAPTTPTRRAHKLKSHHVIACTN